MDLGLKDVHVLVTGASGGIGLEIARLFAAQGARVTAHYNTNQAPLQPLLAEFSPDRVQTIQANLIEETAVVDLFSQASTSSFGGIQVLILNHGIWPTTPEPLWKLSLERWRHTMDTNLTSSFIVAKQYLRHLETASAEDKEKAAIILIGSTAGKFGPLGFPITYRTFDLTRYHLGEAGHADYAASKSAMMYGLTLSLKNEIVKIAPKGRVNSIAPGWVVTPMAEAALKNPATIYQALATTPLKKVAMPYDVATQVVILSSATVSGHITGQVLMIEGGMEGEYLNTALLKQEVLLSLSATIEGRLLNKPEEL